MELFRTEQGIVSDRDFADGLEPHRLAGRPVLVYSRLLSFGRITGRESIARILDLLLEAIGPEGTLCIPAYTFSAFNQECFDYETSPSRVGVLGDAARLRRGFTRTVHPVYSHACWGKEVSALAKQDRTTCFGAGSFFDLFCDLPGAYILALGTTLSAVTAIHYYDQRYGCPGRFVKRFEARIRKDGLEERIEFDSYVRDYEFYKGRSSCLARFDALATSMRLITRTRVGWDWMHGMEEDMLARLYKGCLESDPEYFLIGTDEEFVAYYQKNEFTLYHGRLDGERTARAVKPFQSGRPVSLASAPDHADTKLFPAVS
jgi:aminoglycoside 3-N-acetyltransferase